MPKYNIESTWNVTWSTRQIAGIMNSISTTYNYQKKNISGNSCLYFRHPEFIALKYATYYRIALPNKTFFWGFFVILSKFLPTTTGTPSSAVSFEGIS